MTFNAVAAEWLFRLFYNNRVNDFMIRNLRRQKRSPFGRSSYVNLTSRLPEIPFVHSSRMIAPFGLTDALIEEERADRPALFLNRPLEFFRLLA